MSKARFLKGVVAVAKSDKVTMPWYRGRARTEMIEKRKPDAPKLKSA